MTSCPTFYLWLQTFWDGITQTIGILRRPILVIDLHKLDFGELLEVQGNQIGDGEIAPIRRAGAGKEYMRDTIAKFESAVAGESIIESNPAKLESFGGAGTFEVFIQDGLWKHVGTRPTVTGYDEGRQVVFITELVHQIKIDQPELRSGGWDSRPCCRRGAGVGRRARWGPGWCGGPGARGCRCKGRGARPCRSP